METQRRTEVLQDKKNFKLQFRQAVTFLSQGNKNKYFAKTVETMKRTIGW
jgi:hypothetical protein